MSGFNPPSSSATSSLLDTYVYNLNPLPHEFSQVYITRLRALYIAKLQDADSARDLHGLHKAAIERHQLESRRLFDMAAESRSQVERREKELEALQVQMGMHSEGVRRLLWELECERNAPICEGGKGGGDGNANGIGAPVGSNSAAAPAPAGIDAAGNMVTSQPPLTMGTTMTTTDTIVTTTPLGSSGPEIRIPSKLPSLTQAPTSTRVLPHLPSPLPPPPPQHSRHSQQHLLPLTHEPSFTTPLHAHSKAARAAVGAKGKGLPTPSLENLSAAFRSRRGRRSASVDLRSRYAFSFPRRGGGEVKREIKKEKDEKEEVGNEAKEAEKKITLGKKEKKEKETPRKHRPPPLDLDTFSSIWEKTQKQEHQDGENVAAGVTMSRPTTPPEALFTPKTAALVRAMEEGEEEEGWTTRLSKSKGHPVDDYHTSDSEGNQSDDIGGPTGLRKSMERRRIAR